VQGERARVMRLYADLHMCPSLDDAANARSMADVLIGLEIALVGLVIPPDRLTSTPPAMNSFRDAGLDVAKRLDLNPRSREELLGSLRRFRTKYEIVAVNCRAQPVSRVAVRDRRVDIVQFPKQGPGSSLQRNLANTCRAALEFNISELTRGQPRPGYEVRLRRLRREIQIAREASISVIGSSNASNPFELRSPRDTAAVLHMLGFPLEAALAGVSEVPLAIVKQNRLRAEEPRLDEGVRIVRRATHDE
jgi:RNase P/RNase MRP subunit p30